MLSSSSSPQTLRYASDVDTMLIVASSGSLFGCFFVLASYAAFRRLRRHPSSLIIVRCILDLLFCALTLTSAHVFRQKEATAADAATDCQTFSFFTQYLAVAAELYSLIQSVDLLSSISNPFSNYRSNLRRYHMATFLAAGVSAGLLLAVEDRGKPMYGRDGILGVCWVRRLDPSELKASPSIFGLDHYMWVFFILPLAVIYVLSICALALARLRLLRGLPETFETRLTVFRASWRFIFMYALYWILAMIIYVTFSFADLKTLPPEALSLVLAFALGSRGIVTCLVWIFTYGSEIFSLLMTSSSAEEKQILDDDDSDTRPTLNNALRKEILYYATLGIAKSVIYAVRHANPDGVRLNGAKNAYNRFSLSRDHEKIGLRRQAAVVATAAAKSSPLGVPSADIGVNIREPLLAADDETEKSTRNPAARVHLARVASTYSLFGAAMPAPAAEVLPSLSTLTANILTGDAPDKSDIVSQGKGSLQDASGSQRPPQIRSDKLPDFDELDFEADDETLFRRMEAGRVSIVEKDDEHVEHINMDSGAESHSSWNWFNFAPKSHPPTRRKKSVSDFATESSPASAPAREPYLPNGSCFSGLYASIGHADDLFQFTDFEPHLFSRIRARNGIRHGDYVRTLSITRREKFSEGASGAFLYFSSCERFIVKTMTYEEAQVLLSMISDYENFMLENPNSLITKFYGCHAITMYGTTLYFCVMQNVLISYGAVVHERYDLKGSWINRRLVKPEYGQRIACRHCGQRFRFGGPREQNQCPARPNHSHEANTVMRDTDWVYKLRLGPHQSDALIQVINADTEFLRSQGIMDYSLLLGIHRSKYRLMHAEEFDDVGRHTPSAAGNTVSESKGSQMTSATAPVPSLNLNRAESMSPDARKAMAPASPQWGIDWTPSALDLQSRDATSSTSPNRLTSKPPDIVSAVNTTGITVVDEISPGGNPIIYHEEENVGKKFQAPPLQPSIFTAHRGGLRAAVVEGPGVYYMGIIDVLQRWTLAKRIENFFKTRVLFKDTRGLSAIAPNSYAMRFRSRVIGQLIEIPE